MIYLQFIVRSMVSDTVLGAIIGVSGAVVGSLLTGVFNWLTTKQRIQAENNRRHAEFYMENKVERLTEIHSKLAEASEWFVAAAALKQESGKIPSDSSNSGKLSPDKLRELSQSLQISISNGSIYLNDEQEAILRRTVDDLWNACSHLENDEKDIEEEYVMSLVDTTKTSQEVLSKEISEPIEKLESQQ